MRQTLHNAAFRLTMKMASGSVEETNEKVFILRQFFSVVEDNGLEVANLCILVLVIQIVLTL